jgi:hypothetical protein
LIDRRWHLCTLDVGSFWGAGCVTGHNLVAAEVMEGIAVSEKAAQK